MAGPINLKAASVDVAVLFIFKGLQASMIIKHCQMHLCKYESTQRSKYDYQTLSNAPVQIRKHTETPIEMKKKIPSLRKCTKITHLKYFLQQKNLRSENNVCS